MTSDLLLRPGFRCFPEPSGHTLYQKRVVDRDGATLYFINIFHHPRADACLHPGYEWDVSARLYLPDSAGGATLTITYARDLDLARIEGFFARAYEVLGCVPDPRG